MKKTAIALLLVFAASFAFAQQATTSARKSSLLNTPRPQNGRTNVTKPASVPESATATGEAPALNWDAVPVDLVLQAYGEQVDKTILKDPTAPTATITLKSRQGQKLTKAEYLEAIEAILEMNGIHLEPYGDRFIRALPRKDVRKEGIPLIMDTEQKLNESTRVVSMMIPFRNISTEEAQKVLEGLKSNAGQLLVFERTNSILVTDTEQNINRMLEIVRMVDISTPITEQVFVRQIKNATAAEIKTALEAIVTDSKTEQEKNGKIPNQAAQQQQRPNFTNRLLNRNQPKQPEPVNNASLVMSVSDADRGMIRGKVLILADERSNKLVIITSKANMDFFDKVIEQLDVETTPDIVVKVYRLKYADSEDVSDMINDLIGNASSSKSSSKNNQNQNAKKGTSGNLSRTTAPTPAKKPANQRTGDPKAGELSKDNTTVLSDKRINGLVVMTNKELVPTIESIIESMDIKLSQVLIETAIIEVTLGKNLNTGVDWVQNQSTGTDPNARMGGGGGSNAGVLSAMSSSKTYTEWYAEAKEAIGTSATDDQIKNYIAAAKEALLSGSSVSPIGSGINLLFKSDKLNLSAVINAAKTDARSKYIASPIVMTVDNKEATINATDMTYLLKGFTSSGNSYSTIAVPDYEQKELGIEIKTTPKINPNGTVMLEVETKYTQKGADQTIKYSAGNTSSGSSALQDVSVPTTSTREMSADVLLENMQTVVLGGLTDTYTSESETGIPILKDIPWIGKWLFGKVVKDDVRKELLIFMTPYVLDDSASAQAEAIRRKKTMSDTRPWDDHGWSASKLADPVSKKEQLRRLKDEWEKQDEERKNQQAIEQEKVNRIKKLKEMTKDERDQWLELHKDDLKKEQKEALEKKMLDSASQEELKKLAERVREQKLTEAAIEQKKADELTAADNERTRLEKEKEKSEKGEAAVKGLGSLSEEAK